MISGVGAVTGFGVGVGALWDGLCSGRTAVGPITRLDASGFRPRLGAEIKEFSARDFVPRSYRKAVKVMARDIEIAVAAAKEAAENAGVRTRGTLPEGSTEPPTHGAERMGCQIGAGLIAAEADELSAALDTARGADGRLSLRAWGGDGQGGSGGMDNLTPLWLLKYLPNMLACHVTIIHGCEGPSNTITCAEASGLLSIGESARVIERGSADLCFSGGAESKLNYMGLLRMDLAGRLAEAAPDEDARRVCRPYHPETRGGVVGEGGGIFILEEASAAAARGARPYAEVAGFGAAHSSTWYEDGEDDEGYLVAIESALADARVGAEAIDAVVPLGLGVKPMDRAELGALRRVFGPRLNDLPLVTTSPAVGNCMAGAAAVQAVVGAMCVREQRLPPSLLGGIRPREAGPAALRSVLVCSGSLGGQNAAAVFSRVEN